jgi:hypothetical protein
MARAPRRGTRLTRQLRALEAETDRHAEAHGAAAGALYREIWNVLTGDASFEAVRELSRKAAGLATPIERHVHGEMADALAKAVLEHTEFATSQDRACQGWRVHPSEWRYVVGLADRLGEKLARGVHLREWPPAWVSEVEQYHEEIEVFVEDLALHDMLFGALEAYTVPKGRGSRYTEVYGLCFGSVKRRERAERGEGTRRFLAVSIRRVALQLRARAAAGRLEADPRSQEIQLAMAAELFPHLELVGDFHSHPYATLGALRSDRGWEYTDSDESANQEWVAGLEPEGYRPRVGLILALARGQRRGKAARMRAPHLLRATIGPCHCYLAAYRIHRDGTYGTDDVALACPTITGLGR